MSKANAPILPLSKLLQDLRKAENDGDLIKCLRDYAIKEENFNEESNDDIIDLLCKISCIKNSLVQEKIICTIDKEEGYTTVNLNIIGQQNRRNVLGIFKNLDDDYKFRCIQALFINSQNIDVDFMIDILKIVDEFNDLDYKKSLSKKLINSYLAKFDSQDFLQRIFNGNCSDFIKKTVTNQLCNIDDIAQFVMEIDESYRVEAAGFCDFYVSKIADVMNLFDDDFDKIELVKALFENDGFVHGQTRGKEFMTEIVGCLKTAEARNFVRDAFRDNLGLSVVYEPTGVSDYSESEDGSEIENESESWSSGSSEEYSSESDSSEISEDSSEVSEYPSSQDELAGVVSDHWGYIGTGTFEDMAPSDSLSSDAEAQPLSGGVGNYKK